MLAEFMLVSGWIFWAIVAALVLIEIWLLNTDDDGTLGLAVAIVVIAFFGAVFFSDAFAKVRPEWLIAGVIAYVILGVIWSIKKWRDYVIGEAKRLRNVYDVDKKARETESWTNWSKARQPRASTHKQRIVAWMTLWPWSVSWWMLTWPRRAFAWLYDRLSTIFDRITDSIFASAK